jgi:hypothetical protein
MRALSFKRCYEQAVAQLNYGSHRSGFGFAVSAKGAAQHGSLPRSASFLGHHLHHIRFYYVNHSILRSFVHADKARCRRQLAYYRFGTYYVPATRCFPPDGFALGLRAVGLRSTASQFSADDGSFMRGSRWPCRAGFGKALRSEQPRTARFKTRRGIVKTHCLRIDSARPIGFGRKTSFGSCVPAVVRLLAATVVLVVPLGWFMLAQLGFLAVYACSFSLRDANSFRLARFMGRHQAHSCSVPRFIIWFMRALHQVFQACSGSAVIVPLLQYL